MTPSLSRGSGTSIDSDRDGNNSYNFDPKEIQRDARTKDDAFGNNAENGNGGADYSEAPPIPREPARSQSEERLYGDTHASDEAQRFGTDTREGNNDENRTGELEQRSNDSTRGDSDEERSNDSTRGDADEERSNNRAKWDDDERKNNDDETHEQKLNEDGDTDDEPEILAP